MEMPPYNFIYSITCHQTTSKIKNGVDVVRTTAQISWILHIFAKAVRCPLISTAIISSVYPSHPWLARSLLAFSVLSGCYISVVAVIPLCHSPWTDGEYTGSCECSPVAACHLLQCLTDVTAHRGWSRPLLKTRGVRLRRPHSLAGDPCFVFVCRLCQASLQGQRRGAERAIFAGSPFLLTALMTGVSDSGAEDWGDEGVVLFKYFHLIFLSAWSRGCHTETIWHYDNLAFWAERDIFAAFNRKKMAN